MSQSRNKPSHYSKKMILLHWGIALLVTIHLVNALTLHLLRDIQTVLIIQELHRSFGLLIVITMVIRLVIRSIDKSPELSKNLPNWQKRAAQITHLGFYLILLTAPFIGWAYTNSIGMPVSFFWILPMPELIAYNPEVGFVLLDLHIYMAFILLALITVHIAGSFYNKFVLKNSIFEKMLITSKANVFSAYIPVWLKMTIASGAALLACGIIGFSGIQSTNIVGDAYDKVFQSVVKVRSAQSDWERFSTRIAWQEIDKSAKIKIQLDKIIKDLTQAIPKISRQTTSFKVLKISLDLRKFSERASFDINKDPLIRQEISQISSAFTVAIQELAAIVFETKQKFETLAAQQNDKVVLTMVIVFCLAAITIIFMTATTSVQITRATKLANEIAAGNVQNTISIQGTSETALLMRSLENMRKVMRDQYQWLHDTYEEKANSAGSHSAENLISILIASTEIKTTAIDETETAIYIKIIPGLRHGQEFSIIDTHGHQRNVRIAWMYNEIAGLEFIETEKVAKIA